MQSPKHQSQLHSIFWQRAEEDHLGVAFKQSWLNKITEDAQIQYVKDFKNKTAREKFKHILSVPLIVTDQQFLRRRKTFETYTKNATLDLYYLQLKKANGVGKSISEKADYKEVLQQTKNNKIQNEYLNTLKRNQGVMYDNALWSDRYYNDILQQSRLSNLQKVLQRNKFKGREELLTQFEQFFASKQFNPEAKKSVPELIIDLQNAFGQTIETSQKEKSQEKEEVPNQSFTRPCTTQQGRNTTETRRQNYYTYHSQYSKRSNDYLDTNTRCSTNHGKHRKFKQSAIQKINQIVTQADDLQLGTQEVFKQLQEFKDYEENQKTQRSEIIRANARKNHLIHAFSSRNKIDVRKKFEKKQNYEAN